MIAGRIQRTAESYSFVVSVRGAPVYRFSRDWTALRILDNSRVAQDNRMMMMNVSISYSQGIMIVYSFVSLKAAFVILRIGSHKRTSKRSDSGVTGPLQLSPIDFFLRNTSPACNAMPEVGKLGKLGATFLLNQAWKVRGKGGCRRWSPCCRGATENGSLPPGP